MNFKRSLSLAIMTMCLGVCLTYAQSISPQKDDKKGTWGYVNPTTGKWVVKPKYESAGQLTLQPDGQMKAVVVKKGLTGFVDEKGKESGVGIVFEDMTPLQGDAILVTVKGKKGVANYDGVYLVKPEITEIQPVGDEGYIVTVKGKKGFLSGDGRMTIAPIYTSIDPNTGEYFIVMKNDKSGILKRDGSMILEPKEYTNVEKFDDYWKVSKKDKKGLFKEGQNELVVKCKYEDVDLPSLLNNSPMYPVKKKGMWGLTDSKGREVIECKNLIAPICLNQDNFVICSRNDLGFRLWLPKEGVFIELGSATMDYIGPYMRYAITPLKPRKEMLSGMGIWEGMNYESTYDIRRKAYYQYFQSDRQNSRRQNGAIIGFAMRNGDSITEDIKSIGLIDGSPYAYIEKNDSTYSIFHKVGREPLISGLKEVPEYVNHWLLTSNQAITEQGDLLECIKGSDRTVFIKNKDCRWYRLTSSGLDTNSPFDVINPKKSEGGFDVMADGKWGYIKDGKVEIECKYPAPLSIFLYKDRIYKISDGENVGIVDIKTDKITIPFTAGYNQIESLSSTNQLASVRKGDLWGVVNYYNGHEVLPPLYDQVTYIYDSDIIKASKNGRFTYFSWSGQQLNLKPNLRLMYNKVDNYGHLAFRVQFNNTEGETYKIVATIYTSRGKYVDSVTGSCTPRSLCDYYGDTIWLSNLGRGTYELRIAVYDSKGKSVTVNGNYSLDFYI